MKKSLIALAALAAMTAASAQSTVTVSGGLLLGVGTTKKDTTSTGVQIARQTGNFAFKGTEDLGGGLKANFEVQSSIGAIATTSLNVAGAAPTALALGDRGAYINVEGGFGTVTVGRTASAIRGLFGAIGDVSRIGVVSSNGLSAGSSASTSDAAGGDANAFVIYGDAYVNNVSYVSPAFNGFTAAVAVAQVDGNTSATKDTMSYTVQYANGPLVVAYNLTDSKQTKAVQYITQGTNTGTATGTADLGYIAALGAYKHNTLLVSYDLGVAKVGFTHQTTSLATGVNPGSASAITANVPLGASSIGFGYGKRSNTAVSDVQFGDGVKQMHVGYRYDLSKRTNVQVVHARIDRQGTATDIKMNHVLIGHSF